MADDSRHAAAYAPRTVVFALYDKVTLQDVAGPLEIFARANDFGAKYRVLLVSPTGEPVATTAYASLNADTRLAEVPDSIDTFIVPGGVPPDFTFTPIEHDIPEEQTPDVVEAALEMVRALAPRARRVASVCTGAFVLAAVGLLDGRRATTHWAHCQALARKYPNVEVDADSLFVQDGPYITGAGINAGIDMALALVESDYGAAVARRVARWMVVFLQRPPGNAWPARNSGFDRLRSRSGSLDRGAGGARGGERAAPGAHVRRSGRRDAGEIRRASAARGGKDASRG
jgi:transcriptional regulator GlxA family with amidase domain